MIKVRERWSIISKTLASNSEDPGFKSRPKIDHPAVLFSGLELLN
jgi:hypothetical protein